MQITSQNLDHLGLVAGMCDELEIARIIDGITGDQAHNKHLTYGQAVVAMILNGLGFVSRTLYLYSEYFEDKPVGRLLGNTATPSHLDDNVLGRTLDKLFSIGVTDLFTKIALKALKKLGIKVKALHLDSTSFHVDGEYESSIEQGESRIQLVPGYSRDHRPDLNQAVLQLMTTSQGNLPLYMQAADGNANDKTAFCEIVSQHLKSFKEALDNRYFIGDSALYVEKTIQLLDKEKHLFITRVPMQIKEAKDAIINVQQKDMIDIGEGYKACEYSSDYGGVQQRWIIIFSKAAYERECHTLKKNFIKGSEREAKEFFKIQRLEFKCLCDAQKYLDKFLERQKYIDIIDTKIVPVEKRMKAGRPKKNEVKDVVGYKIEGFVIAKIEKKQELEKQKGYFLLATNDLDVVNCPPQEVLALYKAQQSVERGFRFLKSPDFLVSSFFLKKPERIEALLMVMTLCLLVYAAIEYKIREKLQETGEKFPDQKKRPSQKPTARWVFFCFLGLHIVSIEGQQKQVTNLKERHKIILMCLGPPYQKFYYSEMW
ncbi:MAG: IS1634 family transposase [Chlamydiae bacterium]|nr:IS1634 family transposase [Chlamydiota bacterium]